MADNKLELVVEVDANRANASIKSVNASLSSMEAAAAKSARGASQGIDGMTMSMVKGATAGNLLADAIKQAIESVKGWTVEAANMAAHEIKLEASGRALAKAHGILAGAFDEAVEAVRKIGFHGEEAIHTIDRMIVADLDLSRAQGLAKIAKDAAAIENLAPGEALEKILQAIEFGNARALRAAGLRVDFEKEIQIRELQLGRTLSDNEKVQLRYNAVVQAAAAIQGAHAGAVETAEFQMQELGREVVELREAMGAQFQDAFKATVQAFRDLVGWLKDNTDLLVKFGETALWVAGILATYGLATKIMELAKSIAALRLASLNPFALLATGVLAAGAILYSNWKGTQEQLQARADAMEKEALREDLFKGKVKVDDLRKRGMTDDQIRALVAGKPISPGESFDVGGPKVSAINQPDIDALKRAQEIRKRQAEIDRDSLEAALAAEARAVTGPAKILLEIQKQIAKYTTFVDDRGVAHQMRLTAQTRENLERELRAKVREMEKEDAAAYLKEQQEAYEQRLAWESDLYQKRLANDEQIAKQNIDHLTEVYQFEEQRAGYGRDAELRAVEATDAQTLQQKVWVEQRKMEIEVDYLERVNQIKLRLFDLETSRVVLEEEANLRRLGYRADEIQARIGELAQQREDLRQQQQESTDAGIQAARENAALRQAELIRDHNRQIFESLKQQAGGVFDTLLTKSQSIWSAIGNSFKVAILTAIKDVLSSRVAAMLMQLFTGTSVSMVGGGSSATGIFGRLGSLLGIGAVPVFGAGGGAGGGPIPGGAAGGWGTPPFIPGSAGSGPGSAGLAGALSVSRWSASSLAPLGLGASLLGLSGAYRLGQNGGLGAVGGAGLGAFSGLLGFGALTSMFPALVAAGPVGWIAAAGIGAFVGLFGLFHKSAEKKAREKIKATYGVDISDQGILRQIVETAKQAFGGNLDVAIRSPQIRDLVELYAMSSGQKATGIPGNVTPVSLVQTGGSLFQSPTYQNGSALPGLGGLPSLDRIGSGVASNAGAVVIPLQIDSTAVGSVIIQNGRVVTQGAITAMKSNAGRREMTALQLSPGLLTA